MSAHSLRLLSQLSQLSQLSRDTRGAAIVEFALMLPVLLGLLMFVFDTGYYLYVSSVLGGEVSAAGRASTLESSTDEQRAKVEEQLTEQVRKVVPGAKPDFEYKSYLSYSRAQAVAEPFKDTGDADGNGMGDGECNYGEVFEDENGNNNWDKDIGRTGNGGARDVVIFTAKLEYDRLFPLAGLLGFDNRVRMSSSTILRNQPFANQAMPSPTEGKCAS